MVKRWCAALLCTLLTVSLTGCGSLLNREWYEVKDHSPPYYEGEGRDVLRPVLSAFAVPSKSSAPPESPQHPHSKPFSYCRA